MSTSRPDHVTQLEPGLRRVLADNPSPMTHWGTNTYVLGEGRVAIIDPGPASTSHLQAIRDALRPGETISHIIVTHSHTDHSTLAKPLARQTGAPVYAFGNSRAGRSAVMEKLSASGLAGGGEGVDPMFEPDETIRDGQEISGEGWSLTALWTPGHFSNHMCFAWNDVVFTGDHVMDWASTLVSPPDGDLGQFMESTHKLAARRDRVFYPGHGNPVQKPADRIAWLLEHRIGREKAIEAALQNGPATAADIARMVYTDINPAMLPMATRNVFAHLVDLAEKNRVRATPVLSLDATFEAI